MPATPGRDDEAEDRHDLAAHAIATSEPAADPKETARRLFGGTDPETSAAVRETIVELFEGDVSSSEGTSESGGGGCVATDHHRPDEETRHEVHLDDRIEYAYCVDGALFAAELTEEGPVTVRSHDPITDEPVTFEVADDGPTVEPDDAVVSAGMATAVPETEDMESVGLALARGEAEEPFGVDDPLDLLCRNFNAFERVDTYRRWATDADATTVAVPAGVFAATIHRLVSGAGVD